jgi:hypothetical protein
MQVIDALWRSERSGMWEAVPGGTPDNSAKRDS